MATSPFVYASHNLRRLKAGSFASKAACAFLYPSGTTLASNLRSSSLTAMTCCAPTSVPRPCCVRAYGSNKHPKQTRNAARHWPSSSKERPRFPGRWSLETAGTGGFRPSWPRRGWSFPHCEQVAVSIRARKPRGGCLRHEEAAKLVDFRRGEVPLPGNCNAAAKVFKRWQALPVKLESWTVQNLL